MVDNVFVPASHTYSLAASPQAPGPLYHPRLLFTVAWAPTVANALGMARGAIDTFIELASQAHSTSSTTLRIRSVERSWTTSTISIKTALERQP